MLLVRNKGILGWKYWSGGWKTHVAAEGGSLRFLPPGAEDRPGSCGPKDAWVTRVLGEWAGLSPQRVPRHLGVERGLPS